MSTEIRCLLWPCLDIHMLLPLLVCREIVPWQTPLLWQGQVLPMVQSAQILGQLACDRQGYIIVLQLDRYWGLSTSGIPRLCQVAETDLQDTGPAHAWGHFGVWQGLQVFVPNLSLFTPDTVDTGQGSDLG